MTQQTTHFPFACGNAIVQEDRITVKKSSIGKKSLDISFENIRSIQESGSHCSIITNDGGRHIIRSPKRDAKGCLLEIWQTHMVRLLKSQGYLSGEIKNLRLSDRIGLAAPPFILFIWIWWLCLLLEPLSVWRHWDRPNIVVFALIGLQLLFLPSALAFMSVRIVRKRRAWSGLWRINHDGFWHGPGGEALSMLTPSSQDGIAFPQIIYGGRRMPLEWFGNGNLLKDLLALHLRKAGAHFGVQSPWPGIIRSFCVPLLILGWHAIRKWSGFPLDEREWPGLLTAGLFFWGFWITIQIHYWRIHSRGFHEMTDRLDSLERDLHWQP